MSSKISPDSTNDIEIGQPKNSEIIQTKKLTPIIRSIQNNSIIINTKFLLFYLTFFPVMFLIGPIVWLIYALNKKKLTNNEYAIIIFNIITTVLIWIYISKYV
jgi:hypothetical protein